MRFLLLSLLLLSAAAFGGTKVTPTVGSNMSILNSNNTGYLSGTNYWKKGDNVTAYIERLGRHTPVGVTPTRSVPLSRIVSSAKSLMRLSPSAIASSLAFGSILDAADWAIDELTGQIVSTRYSELPPSTSYYRWKISRGGYNNYKSSPLSVCQDMINVINDNTYEVWFTGLEKESETQYRCRYSYYRYSSPNAIGTGSDLAYRQGTGCPENAVYDQETAACSSVISLPVTPAEIDDLPVTGDAPFYDQLMRDACNLSSSPSRCFEELSDQHKLEGPATVEGPKTTSTSTQTNADGSTSSVEKQTQTDFDIAYGDDHFVYSPKTTTETKVNGQVTETTTEQETADPDSEQKPEEKPVSEIAGLQCEAAVSCSGDAIQCAIAKTQKDTKCILQDAFDYPSQKTDVETAFQGEAFVMDTEEIDIPSFIGQGARFLPSTCPAPIPLALSGKTLQLETQPFCTFANDLSYLIVAFATLAAALYIGRAFGGE
jgi:hypothetical protein